MKPLSQPTTLVDVFPCTRGCVPDSLFSFSLSLSLHLFISLPLRLSLCLFSLLPSFRLSARAKEWPRRGYGGAKSGTNIFDCSCVRECEWSGVFAKTLCSRFSKVRCNYSSGSERRSRARESKGKKEEETRHSTTSERKREARIVPWTSVHETNVRGSLLKRSKTHQPPLLRDPFMSRPPPRFYLRNSYHGHSRELVISGS